MEHLKNTTDLIGLKDKNIKILFVLQLQTHIEIKAKLDYQAPACPHCQENMIKYDFQKTSAIPILDIQGMPSVLKLKKRRFQCKACRRVSVSETPLLQKNHQIAQPVWAKITQLHTERLTNSDIAKRVHVSVSSVQRKLEQFTFKEDFSKLPQVLSWDEFSRNKGKLAFIAQDGETRKIVTVLENNRQATIKNYFYKYTRQVREQVKFVTVDMSASYIPIIKQLFPSAKIILDRFHIIQHLSRAMNRVRIQIMNQFDRKSQEYRALKRYWKLIQQDSRKLSDKRFYRPMFRMHLTNKEILEKLLSYSDELRQHYELYQFLLFHFQEKNSDHFFSLIEQEIATVNPIFQTVLKTFLKDKDKVVNAMELPYSNAKLEATNNLIKVIKRNAFGFGNFENFKKRILIALNIKKERTKFVLSRC